MRLMDGSTYVLSVAWPDFWRIADSLEKVPGRSRTQPRLFLRSPGGGFGNATMSVRTLTSLPTRLVSLGLNKKGTIETVEREAHWFLPFVCGCKNLSSTPSWYPSVLLVLKQLHLFPEINPLVHDGRQRSAFTFSYGR